MKLNPCQSLSSQPEKRYIQHPVRLQSGDEGLDNGRSVRQPATVGRYELTSCHLILAALKSLPSMKVIAVKNPITLINYFLWQVWAGKKEAYRIERQARNQTGQGRLG